MYLRQLYNILVYLVVNFPNHMCAGLDKIKDVLTKKQWYHLNTVILSLYDNVTWLHAIHRRSSYKTHHSYLKCPHTINFFDTQVYQHFSR